MSQAIETRYLGATNTKGARVKATHAAELLSVTVKVDTELSEEENHRMAAQELLNELEWSGTMAGGSTKDGWAWVAISNTPLIFG